MPLCRTCHQSFEITTSDLVFYEKISPKFKEKTYLIPPPTLCPDCRHQRRLTFRNERNLYPRTCDVCHKPMLSIYSPINKTQRVFCGDCYEKENWDALVYGREFDFSKPFFPQFGALLHQVPARNLTVIFNENCDYCNQVWHSKNIYLCFDVGYSQDCFYSGKSHFCKNIMDCTSCKESELLYECLECKKCYGSAFLEQCEGCSDCAFGYDLKGCSHCLFCTNLRQANYHIHNKKVSKEKYETFKNALFSGSFNAIKSARVEFQSLKQNAIRKENCNTLCEHCLGENLIQCKNCDHCFDMFRSQDCKYCHQIDNDLKDCMDCSCGAEGELNYESTSIAGYKNAFCRMWIGKNSLYSLTSFSPDVDHIFGSVGVRHQKYCILNRVYSKEEYETLMPKIIAHLQKTGEWGEFFNPAISPFGYNETAAQEAFPLSKEQALQQGFTWCDYELPPPTVKKTLPATSLPDSLNDFSDEQILQTAFLCQHTGKPFKIIKPELKFYHDFNLPLPRLHPDERHRRRMALKNPRHLWPRPCAVCQKIIQTTYPPQNSTRVYCEECYLKEVY